MDCNNCNNMGNPRAYNAGIPAGRNMQGMTDGRMPGRRAYGQMHPGSRMPYASVNMENKVSCDGCDIGNTPVDVMAVTMCYTPFQTWNEVYDTECGLNNGTIFPELDKPFMWRCVK